MFSNVLVMEIFIFFMRKKQTYYGYIKLERPFDGHYKSM